MSASHPAAAAVTGAVTRSSKVTATNAAVTGTPANAAAASRVGSAPIRLGVIAAAASPTVVITNASRNDTGVRSPARIHWKRSARVTRSTTTSSEQMRCASRMDIDVRIPLSRPLPPVSGLGYLVSPMATSRRTRLDPSVFHLPVERMREGYYSDKYFVRAREILLADHQDSRVTMQVFGKSQAYLGGMDEAIAILKLCADDWTELTVRALYDGEQIEPWETVMTIEGPYEMFAHLETLYLGVLARRTRVGTNTRRVVAAAHPKQIMFFPARHDHWLVQTGDGYAAHIAGAIGVSTDAQASWWGSEGIGTVPHGLIAAYGGDTVLASRKFLEYMNPDARLVTLVDFENDCVGMSVDLANALGASLYGVRIDTSEMLVDKSVIPMMGRSKPTGVTPQLVQNVRDALDRAGHGHVRIVVSGGFTVDKIRDFEALHVPVDAYGVGSSLFQGRFDF